MSKKKENIIFCSHRKFGVGKHSKPTLLCSSGNKKIGGSQATNRRAFLSSPCSLQKTGVRVRPGRHDLERTTPGHNKAQGISPSCGRSVYCPGINTHLYDLDTYVGFQ